MPRVTKAVTASKKHKKVLKYTRGHYGARSRLFKTAKQSFIKSLQYSFRDRRNKKRNFRSLWIARLSAAAKSMDMSYSDLIYNLKKNKIFINRKMLSEISITEPDVFKEIVRTISK